MGFVSAVENLESGGQNIQNAQGSSASGYFQITTPTWQQFAPAYILRQYPTAMSAPLEVQSQVAATIPMGRWASQTLQGLQKQGFQIDPNATFAQNAAANGDTFFTSQGQMMSGGTGATTGSTQLSPNWFPGSTYQGITNPDGSKSFGYAASAIAPSGTGAGGQSTSAGSQTGSAATAGNSGLLGLPSAATIQSWLERGGVLLLGISLIIVALVMMFIDSKSTIIKYAYSA